MASGGPLPRSTKRVLLLWVTSTCVIVWLMWPQQESRVSAPQPPVPSDEFVPSTSSAAVVEAERTDLSTAGNPKRDLGLAPEPAALQSKASAAWPITRSQVRELACGARSLSSVTDSELRDALKAALDQLDNDIKVADEALERVKEGVMADKLARGDYQKVSPRQQIEFPRGALVSGFRWLDNDTPVAVSILPGESPALDDATGQATRLRTEREQRIIDTLDEWVARTE